MVRQAAVDAGYSPAMAESVFPGGMNDVMAHFCDWTDRMMFDRLRKIDPETLKVRDLIRVAVEARLDVLRPYQESVRLSTGYWLRPIRKWQGGSLLWRTADRIWVWAGDESKNYNHYTKRALLSGVLASTILAWLGMERGSEKDVKSFLDRRIDNVLKIGKVMGRFKTARS